MMNNIKINENDSITGEFQLKVIRNDGSVEEYERPMESFVQPFWEVLASAMTYLWDPNSDLTYANRAGGQHELGLQDFCVRDETAKNKNYGILIGSGSTAVSLDDYNLEGEISTNLVESSHQEGTYSHNDRVSTFTRTFENVSGGDIDVSEFGIVGTDNKSTSLGAQALLTRDVISPITLSDGEILSITIRLEWTSFLVGFGNLFFRLFVEDENQSFTEIDGDTDTVSANNAFYSFCQLNYPEHDENSIVVGTGANAVSPTDNKLQTRINGGSSAGQLLYGPTLFSKPTNDGSNAYLTLIRSFTNVSGADITINEVGWYGGTTPTRTICLYRTVLSTPITIADGETHNITLQFSTSL